jgi:6,7-dimethyl-8-ribityllumazine synthase
MIENEQYQEAIELLNTEVYPWVELPETPTEAKASYHLAKARSIYYGQRKLKIHDERNDIAVIREYEEAQRLGGVLEPRDLAALANTHINRDQFTVALQHARDIPESKRYLRDAVFERAIESMLDRTAPMREPAMELVVEMLLDPNLPIEHRIWAMETQGKVQLEQGYADIVITRMLRELPRLQDAQPYDRSRLRLILAEAYVAQGAVVQADEQVKIARELAASGVREEDTPVAWVPGSFELPLVARRFARRADVDGVICIGLVLKGETSHDLHVAQGATRGIQQVMLETDKPVLFGVLTCETLEQARARALPADQGGVHDKGRELAVGVLETLAALDAARDGAGRPVGFPTPSTPRR